MPIDDNLDSVSGWLDGVIDEIGWDMPAGAEGATHGASQTLGEAAIETIIDGIQARALAKCGADPLGGDEEEWLDNESEYRRKKQRLYGEHNPNYRTTQMLSRESLKGEPTIGHEHVEWPYGTGNPSPDGRTKHDRTITDVQKAHYAEMGQSEHDIRRPFFAVTEKDADDVLIVVEDAIVQHIQRKATEP